jgi:hypothetical protein
MVIHITAELEAVLSDKARSLGVSAEEMALEALRHRFLGQVVPVEARDEWERRLFDAALDCGVSVPDSALSSDGLYE